MAKLRWVQPPLQAVEFTNSPRRLTQGRRQGMRPFLASVMSHVRLLGPPDFPRECQPKQAIGPINVIAIQTRETRHYPLKRIIIGVGRA